MIIRPKFFTTYLASLSEAYQKKGLRALVPWALVLGLMCGGLAAWQMPKAFWSRSQWEVSTGLYTGFLAFDGLLLALGWAGFSRIYATLNNGWLAAFLLRNNLLNDHLFFIDKVHVILVASAMSSALGLITILLPIHTYVDMAILAVVIAFSFWALVSAVSTVRLMNDLVWEVTHAEQDQGSDNVVGLRGN